MAIKLTKATKLTIFSETSSYDKLAIEKCYRPIIGGLATALYEDFKCRNYSTTIEYFCMMHNLKFNDFKEILYSLEALKLVDHYQSNDESILIINSPYSIDKFKSEIVLHALLVKRTSVQYVESISPKTPDLTKFENVSKSFSQVFGINKEITIEQEVEKTLLSFNLDKFKTTMYLNEGISFSDAYIDEFRKFAILTDMNAIDARKLVFKTLDKDKNPTLEDLLRFTHNSAKYMNPEKVYMTSDVGSEYAKSPSKFYEIITGEEASSFILSSMENSLVDNKIELFNLSLERCYKIHHSINFLYINKLLEDWKGAGITTVEGAKKRIEDYDAKNRQRQENQKNLQSMGIAFADFNDETL